MSRTNIGTKAGHWAFNKLIKAFCPTGQFPEPLEEDWVQVEAPVKHKDGTDDDWTAEDQPHDKIISTRDEPQKSTLKGKHDENTVVDKKVKDVTKTSRTFTNQERFILAVIEQE